MGPFGHIACFIGILTAFILPTEIPSFISPTPQSPQSLPEGATPTIVEHTIIQQEPTSITSSVLASDVSISTTISTIGTSALDQIKRALEPVIESIGTQITNLETKIDETKQVATTKPEEAVTQGVQSLEKNITQKIDLLGVKIDDTKQAVFDKPQQVIINNVIPKNDQGASQAIEPSTSDGFWSSENAALLFKKYSALVSTIIVLGWYFYVHTTLKDLRRKLAEPSCWAFFKKQLSLSELQALPTNNLTNELLETIANVYANPANTTDCVYPLVQFSNATALELAQAQELLMQYSRLQTIGLHLVFRVSATDIEDLQIRINRLEFIISLFTTWASHNNTNI